jgi:iron complex transport system ATP-binding protein
VLTARNISIGYNQKSKLPLILAKQINLDLIPGQLTAIIGQNGSGKSTLLRTLSGQLEPNEGALLLNGQAYNELSPIIRSKYLAVVLTKKEFSGHLSVLEFVRLGRIPHTDWLGNLTSKDHQAVRQAINATHLTELVNQKCGTLSDGQMQRVSIARALAQDTPIVLLDEPTTHLDLVNKAETLKLLTAMAHEYDKSVTYATHDIELALDIADQIICIHNHTVIAGSPKDIINNGVIEDLFQSDLVRFDAKSKRFSITD